MAVANPDFSAYVQRAKDLNPESIYVFVPGGAQPPAFGKALAERGIDPKQIKVRGQGEITDDAALKSMGDMALGIVTAFHYDPNHQSAMNKKFVADYNADYKRNPDFFSIGGWDGMHAIYETLKKTNGDTDGEKLIGAVKGMAWESPRGRAASDQSPSSDGRGRVPFMIGSLFGVLFDGFAYGMLLFLLSVGLSVTLGMMNFVNLAHCAFAMLGGYVAVSVT